MSIHANDSLEKSPRKLTNVADWKKVSLIAPSSPAKGSLAFGIAAGEMVGVLKITLYDVKIQRKGRHQHFESLC